VVEPIRPKAMPVILTTDEERDVKCVRRRMRRKRCSGRYWMKIVMPGIDKEDPAVS
jgi:hypothetical protein